MTEEALKDEICEYVHSIYKTEPFNGFSYRDIRDVAEHFALSREKQIEELQEENKILYQKIRYLENDKEDILANWYCDKVGKCKVADLEKQIEKIKCCGNCKNYMIEGACGHFTQVGWCRKWELAEN